MVAYVDGGQGDWKEWQKGWKDIGSKDSSRMVSGIGGWRRRCSRKRGTGEKEEMRGRLTWKYGSLAFFSQSPWRVLVAGEVTQWLSNGFQEGSGRLDLRVDDLDYGRIHNACFTGQNDFFGWRSSLNSEKPYFRGIAASSYQMTGVILGFSVLIFYCFTFNRWWCS